jgi:predicted transcriptional regulator of viral defense system
MSEKYNKIRGIGELERTRLSEILRRSQGSVSISEATNILNIPRNSVSKILAKYAQKGWLKRIAPGIYLPVPIESKTSDISSENIIGLAEKLFSPCYISGWTAAEHWGLTDQIFQSIIVVTAHKKMNYQPNILGNQFQLYLSSENRFFGLKIVWFGNIPVKMADPSRLVIDLLYRPEMAGGIRSVTDIFSSYLASEQRNISLLKDYIEKLNSGAVCKRLGFLAEKFCPEEKDLIEFCQKKITQGYSKLDPNLSCTKHLSKWHLLLPENWKSV